MTVQAPQSPLSHPCLVPIETAIAQVEDVFNAVVAEGDFVGSTVFEGRGAGAGPTASAVISDLIDLARGRRTPTFGVPVDALALPPVSPMERRVGAYYIRLTVVDRHLGGECERARRREQPSHQHDLNAKRENDGGSVQRPLPGEQQRNHAGLCQRQCLSAMPRAAVAPSAKKPQPTTK